MKIYTKSLLSICVCLIVLNCTYSPSGNNFNEIEIPEPSSVSFNWLDLEGDTLNFIDRLNINIKVETESENYYRSELLIDSVLVKNFSNTNISYRIEQADYPAGIHEIQLLSYFKTESGSLAEQLHSEYYVATKNWFFKIDNTPCSPVSITDWTVTDEGLIVNWEKYKHSNFYGYILYRQYVGNTNQYAIDNIAFVNKIDSTHALVNDIPGGEYEYRIVASCFMPGLRNVTGEWTVINAGDLKLEATPPKNGTFNLMWTQPTIKNSFSNYELDIDIDNNWTGYHSLFLNQIEDTVSEHKVYFGSSTKYRVQAISKTYKRAYSNWITIYQIEPSFEFPFDAQFFEIDEKSNLFYKTGINIVEFDTQNKNVVSTKSFYSEPEIIDQYVYDIDQLSESDNPKIVRFSKSDFSEIDRLSSQTIFDDGSLIKSLIPSYRSNKLLVKTTSRNGTNPKVHYIDYEQGQVLKTIALSSLDDNVAISPNGNYFIYNHRIYHRINDSQIDEDDTYWEHGIYAFDTTHNEHYYNVTRASTCGLLKVNSENNRLEDSYKIRNTCLDIAFNKFNGTYVVVATGSVFVLDLANEKYNYVNTSPYYNDKTFRYLNGILHSSTGLQMDVPLVDK